MVNGDVMDGRIEVERVGGGGGRGAKHVELFYLIIACQYFDCAIGVDHNNFLHVHGCALEILCG